MKIDFFDEPELEFGEGGTHLDIRHGLMHFGPLDIGEATAPNQIRVGLVGTSETIEGIRSRFQRCEAGIEAKKSRLVNLFPPFPGFRTDVTFRSELVFHERWSSVIRQRDIDDLLKTPGNKMLAHDLVRMFVDRIARAE